MVLQHEIQFKTSVTDDSKIPINAADYMRPLGRWCGNGSPSFGTKKVCTHCGKTGYTVDTCCKKHAFPSHFGKGNAIFNLSSL